MSAPRCDHIFRTTISVEKFEAVVTKACRDSFKLELTACDPGIIPAVRLFTVEFTTPDDRDRVRIAMRFLEKEHGGAGSIAPPHKPAAVAGHLARA